MIDNLFILSGIILIIYAFYKWITMNNDYFEKIGVAHLKPIFLFGNTAGFFFKKYNRYEFISILYKTLPSEK